MCRMDEALDFIARRKIVYTRNLRSLPQRFLHDVVYNSRRALVVQRHVCLPTRDTGDCAFLLLVSGNYWTVFKVLEEVSRDHTLMC